MSFDFHPELFGNRQHRPVPAEQQKTLDRQLVNSESANPEDDIPPSVVASILARADHVQRKRDSHEASLTPGARVSKTAKTSDGVNDQRIQSQTADPSPSTPTLPRRNAANLGSVPPSSSPGTALSWSPSPTRANLQPPQVASPANPVRSELPAPSFPSSVPEEPLEVELPKPKDHPPSAAPSQSHAPVPSSLPRSQEETPLLRAEARTVDTPPCGQPNQNEGSARQAKKRPRLPGIVWDPPIRPSSKGSAKDRISRPASPVKQNSPYQSSVPSSNSIVPTSTQPPPGQGVPHPRFPPPPQPSPSQDVIIPRSTCASQDIVGLTQEISVEGTQSSQGPDLLVQTMSYISPDISSGASKADIPEAQHSQAEAPQVNNPQGRAHLEGSVQRDAPNTHIKTLETEDEESTQKGNHSTEIEETGIRRELYNGKDGGEGESISRAQISATGAPQPELSIVKPTSTKEARQEPRRTEGSDVDGTHAQEPSQIHRRTTTEVYSSAILQDISATSATQQPEKLSITFDEDSDSPFITFSEAYTAYTGGISQFVKACICLDYISRKRSLHHSLYDDFIGAFPGYLIYVKNAPRNKALVAADWYNDRDEDILYTKRLVDKQNLQAILSYYSTEVQKLQRTITGHQRRDSSEPRSARSTPMAAISQDRTLPGEQPLERRSQDTTGIVANTQPDDSEQARNGGETLDGSRSGSTPIIIGTQATISPPTRKQVDPARKSLGAPRDIITKTPSNRDRPASNPPNSLPKTVSAVPSNVVPNKAPQRHSIGILPPRTTNGTQQMDPPSPRPKPPSSAKSKAAAYFASLTKPRSKKEKERLSGFGRAQASDRSSLPRSDAS